MRNDKTMPKDWVSSPLTKWLVNNNVTPHKLVKATNLSPNVVYNVIRGQTLQPREKTILKLCSFTGLSRRQFGFHTRAVREMRKSVDKSVVSRGTIQRIKATKPVDDTFTITITVKASDLPKSITGFLR
jgi:predicted transcriptional regulator